MTATDGDGDRQRGDDLGDGDCREQEERRSAMATARERETVGDGYRHNPTLG